MTVNDPQDWCCDRPASIENVEYEIRTSGLYSEVSIAFDVFTDYQQFFNNETQLEFDYTFNLDDDAVFNDSWLWIEDYISKGELYEKGEGTIIYEEIVDRRQDPSILTKLDHDSYNLKIYPLIPDSTRRVKLSYLVPLSFDKNKMMTSLPMQFLDSSDEYPQNINLTIHDDTNWFHSDLSNSSWINTSQDSESRTYKYQGNVSAATTIQYQSDNPSSKVYFGTYEEEDDKYYQLLYLPEVEVIQDPRHHLILFDYDENQTNITQEAIIAKINAGLKQLTDQDYFTIAYSDFVTKFTSDEWQLATDSNIDQAINKILEDDISTYSRLTSMLPTCLERIEDSNIDIHLDIISSSTELYDEDFAGPYLTEVIEYIDDLDYTLTISAIDFATSKPWSQFENSWKKGNDHFYIALTQITSGNHINQYNGDDISEGLIENYSSEKISSTEFDFDINVTDGFTYSTFYDNLENNTLTFNKPIIATGKYYGEGELSLSLNGIINGELFSEEVDLIESEALLLDSKIKSAWNAEYILENEFNQDYNIIKDVITTSIDERLLSFRTVYLCLEPDTIAISSNNEDTEGDILISTEDELNNIEVSIFPNPFAEKVNIEIPLDQISVGSDIEIEIYNLAGELVYSFHEKATNTNGSYILTWEPGNQIVSGLYHIKIFGKGFNYNTTLICSK